MLSPVPILRHRNLDVLLLYGKQRADLMVLALKQLSSACAFSCHQSDKVAEMAVAAATLSLTLSISLELLLLCFWDIIFRYILDIQRKIFRNSMFVGMLFKAIE